MSRAPWSAAVSELRSQWQVNTRLRAGVWLIAGIVWVYLLLVLGDATVITRKASVELADEIDRLRPLTRANPWPARVDESRRQLAALRSMQWAEATADIGLAEAALQDWVRSTAGKAGLRVRELSLARVVAAPAVGAAVPAVRQAQAQPVRLRISVEWGRSELVAFLAEIGRHERVVVVERLLLRPATPGGSAEIDLRVLASVEAPAAAPSPAAAGGAR